MDPDELAALEAAEAEQDAMEEALAAAEAAPSTPGPDPHAPGTDVGIARGLGQGYTQGFGDELAGLTDATSTDAGTLAAQYAAPLALAGPTLGVSLAVPLRNAYRRIQQRGQPATTYTQERDAARQLNTQAQEANPLAYGASRIAGALPAFATGGAEVAAGLGALGGVGETDAPLSDLQANAQAAGEGAVLGYGGAALGAGVMRAARAGREALGGLRNVYSLVRAAGGDMAHGARLAASMVGRGAAPEAPAARPALEMFRQPGGEAGPVRLPPPDIHPNPFVARSPAPPTPSSVRFLGQLRAAIAQDPARWPPGLVKAAASNNPLQFAREDYVLQQTDRNYAQETAQMRSQSAR